MNIPTTFLNLLALLAPAPRVVENLRTAYAGMDMFGYPGDDLMTYFKAVTNIKWTNAYLVAPGHPDSTWEVGNPPSKPGGARRADSLHFGIAPTYLGNQQIEVKLKPHDILPSTGAADGIDAVYQAVTMGVPAHSVIYLDWETPDTTTPQGTAYCLAWFGAVAEAGFRPGLYSHPPSALALRAKWPDLFGWVTSRPDKPKLLQNEVFDIANGTVTVRAKDPRTNIDIPQHFDRDAVAWQMWFQAKDPWTSDTVFPDNGNAHALKFYGNNPAFDSKMTPKFDMDISSSCMIDPRFPEMTVSPGLVRGGKTGAAAVSDTSIGLFRVLGGRLKAFKGEGLVARSWSPLVVETRADPPLLAYHPWSPPRAIRRGNFGDLAVVTRSGATGTAPDAWDLHVYRRRNLAWSVDEAVNRQIPVSPLLGVRLISRDPSTVEAVFQGQDNLLYIVRTIDTASQTSGPWSAPVAIPSPAGFTPSRVGGVGAVSRGTGIADFFVVAKAAAGTAWRLYWIASPTAGLTADFPGQFARPIASDPLARVHPFSNVAAVSGNASVIDAFVIGQKQADMAWKVYHWHWSSIGGWDPNLESIGGSLVTPHPVSKIAAISFTVAGSQYIDVFIVGNTDGFLYYSRLKGTTWSDFARIGTGDIPIASVDEAILRSSSAVDVVATGRDGNVYVATFNTNSNSYGPLVRIDDLNLGAV